MIHPEFLVVIENIHAFKKSEKELKPLVNAYALTDVLLKEEGGEYLRKLLRGKKPIFSLEYLEGKDALEQYATLAKEKGLIPLVGHRPLKGRFIYADELFHLARPCD